jgi:hypothetical protein
MSSVKINKTGKAYSVAYTKFAKVFFTQHYWQLRQQDNEAVILKKQNAQSRSIVSC